MSIAWAYLDKKAAATDALRDSDGMEHIVKSHPQEMEEVRTNMSAYRASIVSGLSKAKRAGSGEARLAACIDEIDVLRERYRRALEFTEWFQPAWEALSNDERFVLTEFFREDTDRPRDPIGSICDYFHIERTSAYNKKNRALARLALHLYGK